MSKSAKRERSASQTRGFDEAVQLRAVKREKVNAGDGVDDESAIPSKQDAIRRWAIRFDYLAVKNVIHEKIDDLMCPDLEKFGLSIWGFFSLEAKGTSSRRRGSARIRPSDFVPAFLNNFSQPKGGDDHVAVNWA